MKTSGDKLRKKNGVEDLGKLLGDEKHSYHYEGARLSLHSLNVLPQPRKTFEGTRELALDVADKGLVTLPIVARFNEADCERYVSVINILWGTDFSTRDLISWEGFYFILLAGERRYRAHKLLYHEGCDECVEKYGEEKPGTCFERHLGDDKMEVRISTAIPPLPALFLQLSENTHMAVPSHEEAQAYNQLFKLIKEAKGKFTVAEFARKVGRSPETIRNAIKFCELPEKIQSFVELKLIPYGIAIELTRLKEDGMTDSDLVWWMEKAVLEGSRVQSFRDLVSAYLENKHSGQLSLMEIMSSEDAHKKARRQVVEAHALQVLWGFLHYMEKVFQLFESGALGKEDSPFSEGSPTRIFRNLVNKERKLLPHIRMFLPRKERIKFEASLKRAEKMASELELNETLN